MGFLNGSTRPVAHHVRKVPPRAEAAADFIRQQTSAMRCGLGHADDPGVRSAVLATHAASHAGWLEAIAVARRAGGADLAELVTDAYVFHGRVARSLEGALSMQLPDATAASVRQVLSDRLELLQARCVRAFEEIAPTVLGGQV